MENTNLGQVPNPPTPPSPPAPPTVDFDLTPQNSTTTGETFTPVSEIKIEGITQVSPEVVNSEINQTVNDPASANVEPVKTPVDAVKPKKAEHKGKPPVAVIVTGILSFVVLAMIAGLFVLLSKGDSPMLARFGIENVSTFGVLMLSVGIISSILTLSAFIGALIGIFKFMNTKRDDKQNKKKALILAAVSVVLVVVFGALAFVGFSNVKSQAPVAKQELIKTTPAETIGLSAPVTIVFDASNLPIDSSKFKIISYNWDFGDKEQATGPTVNHTFKSKPATGFYTVKLKVSYQDKNDPNSEILSEVFERVVSIENEKVFASFTFNPKQGNSTPLKVNFDASASKDPDGEIVNYEWDFNEDGIFDAEGVKTEYIFEKAGTFNVVLRVTDTNGEYTIASNPLVIKGDSIITGEIKTDPADQVLTPERAYQFDASGFTSTEGNLINYEWNFGDGKISSGRKITHAYTKEGVYEVSLKLRDDKGNQKTVLKNFTVSSSPSGLFAKIQSTPAASNGILKGVAPFRVSFDAGASSGGEIVDYSWDFNGDGVSDAKGQIVEHVFTNAGEFSVNLTITSSDSKTALSTLKTEITGTGLQAKVSANPVNGIVPLVVNFDASSTIVPDGEQIVTFQWDFGDGTPILREGPIVSHRYVSVGTFTATVTAITSQNKTATSKVTVFINSTPLKACYTMSRTVGPAPLTVSFNPQCSTGTISQYTWNFGGLGVSNERKATFTFQAPGEYNVELEVSDADNNVSKFTEKVIVQN